MITAPAASADQSTEAALQAFEASVTHHHATSADGTRIHYAATGSGPLLVLVHGFPDHWLGWWQVMAALRSDYRLLAIDLRGYNLSDQPTDLAAYDPAHLVNDVRAVMDAEDAERATVVGHDWGGFVAWHTAMAAPERVERLIVLNMPHPWAIARELAINPAQHQASEYARHFSHPHSHTHLPREVLTAWVQDPAFKPRQEQAMARSSLEAMLNYYRANWPAEPYAVRPDAPPPVQCPTLLIHGLADPYALPAGLNDVWQWINPRLTIETLPGQGHFIQHDCAHEVVALMRRWLTATPVVY